ncbi:uncharacterized protein [Cicer arietinum]|uniref:Uncharacterized protein LOC101498670 isoform X1 n=1 Tax=Cicer arietinum TaxID=3827 RepID=A0A1S2YU55_CICAR|nr:uncharacterized protein LOC101498670 isoform X1 [Cicer arietinum]
MESTKIKPNNNKSRSKRHHLFQCFKPDDVVDPPPRRKAKNSDPLLSYIALAEKHGIVLPTVLSSALMAAKGGGDGSASRRRKIGKERSLRIRQVLISALNHTSLGKKIINRSKTKKNTWSRSRMSKLGGEADHNTSNTNPKVPYGTYSSNPSKKYGNNSYTSSSHCSPPFTPSTLSSSTFSSNSQGTQVLGSSFVLYPNPMNGIGVKQDVKESRKGCFGSNIGLYLLFFY